MPFRLGHLHRLVNTTQDEALQLPRRCEFGHLASLSLDVFLLQMLGNQEGWHGTKLDLTIQGAWASHRAFILRYLRQIAVITPYAQISFKYASLDGRNDIAMTFKRRTLVMPDPPRQVFCYYSLLCRDTRVVYFTAAPAAVTGVYFVACWTHGAGDDSSLQLCSQQ